MKGHLDCTGVTQQHLANTPIKFANKSSAHKIEGTRDTILEIHEW